MSTAADTITVTDLENLVGESVPVACEHAAHNSAEWRHFHGGDATHYAQVIHNCVKHPSGGLVYPVCKPFAAYVTDKYGRDWTCPRCGEVHPGKEMLVIIGTIS